MNYLPLNRPFSAGATIVVAAVDSLDKSGAKYICDGVDDQEEIQDAIGDLPAGGGRVQLLDGTFNISGKISMKQNSVLNGVGIGTILTPSSAIADRFIETHNNCELGFFKIDGKYDTVTDFHTAAIYISGDSNVWLHDLVIENGNGITLANTSPDALIENIRMSNIRSLGGMSSILDIAGTSRAIIRNIYVDGANRGFEVENGSTDILISGFYLIDTGAWGCEVHTHAGLGAVKNVTYENGKIEGTITYAIVCNGGSGDIAEYSRDVVFRNICVDVTANGSTTQNAYRTTIIDCSIVAGERGYLDQGNTEDLKIINSYFNSIWNGIALSDTSKYITIMNCKITVAGARNGITVGGQYTQLLSNAINTSNRNAITIGGSVSNVNIEDNIISGCIGYNAIGINIAATAIIIKNNDVSQVVLGLLDYGNNTVYSDQHTDLLQDVLALSANHIVNAEDLSVGSPITCTLAAQPDVPRTLSWVLTHAQITEFTIDFVGVDAKGNIITETVTEADGWSGELNNAFATITSITFTREAGTGVGDTLDVGIADKLGLSNIIYAAGDVFKVKENNADYTNFTVDATYHTVSIDGVIGAASDYTIWYRTNLNIIG